MAKLIAEGRMTQAGLAKYDPKAMETASESGQKIRGLKYRSQMR